MGNAILRGRIQSSGKQDLHGVEVEVFEESNHSGATLKRTTTAADGSYTVSFNADQDPVAFRPRAKVGIRLCTDGAPFHVGPDRVRLQPGRTRNIDLIVPTRVLPDLTPSLARRRGGLISPSTQAAVAQAWEALAHSRGDLRTFPQAVAACPLPPLARFDDLFDLSSRVLEGDPLASAQLGERLDAIDAQGGLNPDTLQRIEELSDELGSADYWKSVQGELAEARSGGGNHTSTVELDDLLTLTSAIVSLSGENQGNVHRNLAILDAQLSGMRAYAPVARAALNFQTDGDLTGFERAWTDFTDAWGPDDRPPWPRPFPEPGPEPGPRPGPGPMPWPPEPGGGLPADPERLERWACTADLVLAVRGGLGLVCYSITDLSNARACPGDQITISGREFGDEPGHVWFPTSGRPLLVEPDTWSDTEIVVTVPDNATCGPLSLRIRRSTAIVCGRAIDFLAPRCGDRPQFDGGSTRVKALAWSSTYAAGCARPGSTVRLTWDSCNADEVLVTVTDSEGNVLRDAPSAPTRATITLPIRDYTEVTTLTARIQVAGPCGDDERTVELEVHPPYNLQIVGTEITQAVQHYKADQHLTDPADQGPDNSLQLVANKPAMLRVYLRSGQIPGFNGGQLPDVGGTVTVERRVGFRWTRLGEIAAGNTMTAEASFASYDAERSDLGASLNFAIPAAFMSGELRFTIQAESPKFCGGSARDELTVDASLQQTLRIAAVSIGFNGVGGPAAPPNPATIQAETNFSLRVMPVGGTPVVRQIATGNVATQLNGTFAAGGCDPAWGPILTMVTNARTNDGNQSGWVYYGFVTPNIPRTHGNVGCAGGGDAAGLIDGVGTTLAHEIGHQAGLPHAPCGTVGTPNPNYPRYEPYDNGATSVDANGNTVFTDASIGEYGLDPGLGGASPAVVNPHPARANNGKDFMSYCGQDWVSIYTHGQLVNHPLLNPTSPSSGGAGGSSMGAMAPDTSGGRERLITVVGDMDADHAVTVSSVSRVETNSPSMDGRMTNYMIELVGDNGEVAATAPVFTLTRQGHGGCGCDGAGNPEPGQPIEPPFSFIAAMPDTTEGAALRIRLDDEVVWERKRPERRPDPSDVSVKASRDGGMTVRWKYETSAPRGADVWLRWSDDEGETWNGLAVGASGRRATIAPGTVPAGPVMVQVLVHDGFHTATAQSEVVEVQAAAQEITIMNPAKDASVSSSLPLRLWALTSQPVDDDDEVTWLVDGKKAATGLDTWISGLKPGTHRLELRVGDISSGRRKLVVTED